MQQEKRGRVFRARLSVKDGEPIYLNRAIESRVFNGTSASLGWASNCNDASVTGITNVMRERCKHRVQRDELKGRIVYLRLCA